MGNMGIICFNPFLNELDTQPILKKVTIFMIYNLLYFEHKSPSNKLPINFYQASQW